MGEVDVEYKFQVAGENVTAVDAEPHWCPIINGKCPKEICMFWDRRRRTCSFRGK